MDHLYWIVVDPTISIQKSTKMKLAVLLAMCLGIILIDSYRIPRPQPPRYQRYSRSPPSRQSLSSSRTIHHHRPNRIMQQPSNHRRFNYDCHMKQCGRHMVVGYAGSLKRSFREPNRKYRRNHRKNTDKIRAYTGQHPKSFQTVQPNINTRNRMNDNQNNHNNNNNYNRPRYNLDEPRIQNTNNNHSESSLEKYSENSSPVGRKPLSPSLKLKRRLIQPILINDTNVEYQIRIPF